MAAVDISHFISQEARNIVGNEDVYNYSRTRVTECMSTIGGILFHPLLELVGIGQLGFPESNIVCDEMTSSRGSTRDVLGNVKLNRFWHSHPEGGDERYRFISPNYFMFALESQERNYAIGERLGMGNLNIADAE